ncbi:MAG TPA: NAD(P)H-dependent oxidoreductase [Clostridia bacterium]|nr:NAD(P)H-dependent oxidoreductase [Clostridia bacterium]
MKILALMGSQRKNGTGYNYVSKIEKAIKEMTEVDFEYVFLSDYDIKMCKGCMVCYEKGEEACPLKDDYLRVIKKLHEADAVIFYSPTYTISISGIMKNFFDRSSYICHRPLFKGKYALIMTTVGAFGEKQALDTLRMIVSVIGYRITGIIGIQNGRYARDSKYVLGIEKRLKAEAIKLIEYASQKAPIKPKFFELLAYNYQKIIFTADTKDCKYDKDYWKNAGWTDPKSTYFYDVQIPILKNLLAGVIVKILIRCRIFAT